MGKSIPVELASLPIGESWEVSAHPNGLSRIANGALAGWTLAEVHGLWGALLVGAGVACRHGRGFPLLVKLIELDALASVQVHPDDRQALRLEGCPTGKSEAWYVVDAARGAEAYVGFRRGVDRARLLDALSRGAARETLEPVALGPGDCLLLEPGTVHACGNGIVLLEVQQSSDLTYRVYDWDRVDESGRPRELHVDKALEVIDFEARPVVSRARGEPDAVMPVLQNRHFRIFEVRLRRSCFLPAAATFTSVTVIGGECALDSGAGGLRLRTGDTVLVPAGVACTLSGTEAILVGAAPEL